MDSCGYNVRLDKVLMLNSRSLEKARLVATKLVEALQGKVNKDLRLTITKSGKMYYETYIS